MSFQQLHIIFFLALFCASCAEPTLTSVNDVTSASSQNTSLNDSVANRAQNIIELVAPPDKQPRATGSRTQVFLGKPQVFNTIGLFKLNNDAPLEGFPIGKTVVVWVVTDSMGNSAEAIQIVNVNTGVACSTSDLFFQQRIWPILNDRCMECHTIDNVSSVLNFVSATVPNYLSINYLQMKKSAVFLDNNNESIFLNKVTNKNNDHGGDVIMAATSPDYQLLSSMVERFGICKQINFAPSDLVFLGPLQQLRKTTLALSGRLPKVSELAAINNAISPVVIKEKMGGIIDGLFTEKAFYQRLKEIYNDLLLTDAFKLNAAGLGLPLNDFDNRNYFGSTDLMQRGYNGTDSNRLRRFANYGVSQAPLELITHVVRNELPFTEILTADYLMVNPYSATIFGANIPGEPNFNFSYGLDWTLFDFERFLPVKIIDNKGRSVPHAGILTTLPFLKRYPSSTTNLNRKRARYVLKYFLDTDVEGLASRAGLDLGNVFGQFPTLQDPQCRICHKVMDPVAGLFKNWNINGRFLGNNQNWLHTRQPPEMLAPGFNNTLADTLPDSESASSLMWLARQISADNRFVNSTVKTIFKGFLGSDIANDPVFYQELKTLFVSQNFNLKQLIKQMVTSPYFLAENAPRPATNDQLTDVGTAHLLTPEQLERKIRTVFEDKQWISPSKRHLLSEDSYLVLYGGIDSKGITIRTTQPTSIMAGIQTRIANQLACELVPVDFSKTISQRNLFPYVSIAQVPDNGLNTVAIRRNIQYLFSHILGRELLLGDAEIERVYTMFVSVIARIGANNISQECRLDLAETNLIVVDALHTVRAWMAVINYLVRDYYFLYE